MKSLRPRAVVLPFSAVAIALLALAETNEVPLRMVYNVSPSAPLGFYLVSDPEPIRHADLVLMRLPEAWRAWAARRGYIGKTVPLIKRVAALAGDHVCAHRGRLFLNGRMKALALERDSRNRPMPRWRGCRTLRAGEVFALMAEKPDSFDSRYFGPLRSEHIVGRLQPLWLP